MKIKSIKKKPFKGHVYNLGLEGKTDMEHTYYANGVLVHNCRSVWIPITREEIEARDAEGKPEFENTALTKGKNGKPITTDQVTAQLESIPAGKNKSALDEKTFSNIK